MREMGSSALIALERTRCALLQGRYGPANGVIRLNERVARVAREGAKGQRRFIRRRQQIDDIAFSHCALERSILPFSRDEEEDDASYLAIRRDATGYEMRSSCLEKQ